MYSKRRLANYVVQLVHPHLTSIVAFQRTARNKTALVNCEHECVKELAVSMVKWDVDETDSGSTGVCSSRQQGYRFDRPRLAPPRFAPDRFAADRLEELLVFLPADDPKCPR